MKCVNCVELDKRQSKVRTIIIEPIRYQGKKYLVELVLTDNVLNCETQPIYTKVHV